MKRSRKNDRAAALAGIASLLSRQFDISKLAVEFGAGNGLSNTVTRDIVSRLKGWKGLWIEAHPQVFDELKQRVEEDKLPVEVLNVAVSDRNGTIPFYCCTSCAGWSSVVPPEKRKNGRQKRGDYEDSIEVRCLRLPRILRLHGQVGVMVCDVEEHDTVVVADMIRSPIRPAVLMVEANAPGYRRQQTRLLKDDYGLVWDFPGNTDKIYVRRDLLEILG